MHTSIAFSEVVGINAGWDNINAVADQHIKTEAEFIYISEFNKLIGAKAYGTTRDMVRLQSPAIRRVNPYHINGFELAVSPAGHVDRAFFPDAIVPLDSNEALECEIFNAPGVVIDSVVLFLASGGISKISGNIYVVRFTTDVVLVASTWCYGEIDLPDGLPVGSYDVVGARVEGAAIVAFRFVPVGGFNRPGGVCVATEAFDEPHLQRKGGLGVWFNFNSVQLPGIEILDVGGAGACTLTGYFDLIRK